jgi:predicted kinase
MSTLIILRGNSGSGRYYLKGHFYVKNELCHSYGQA